VMIRDGGYGLVGTASSREGRAAWAKLKRPRLDGGLVVRDGNGGKQRKKEKKIRVRTH
jgi:hypothetical protein